jgi:hypothetical protein
MIATSSQGFDVFVSHSAEDRDAAEAVARRLGEAGMSVQFDRDLFVPGRKWESALRKALVESDAFVLLVDSSQPVSPNGTFELGAAMALQKPVFVVQTDGQSGDLPGYLRHYAAFPLAKIERLASSIRDVCEPLANGERESLIAAYQELGVPSDRLLADPLAIEQLGDTFKKRAGRSVPARNLASELLRMRKAGRLPRLRPLRAKE